MSIMGIYIIMISVCVEKKSNDLLSRPKYWKS